jgi:YgiT-type zinc finger domain-containing protein
MEPQEHPESQSPPGCQPCQGDEPCQEPFRCKYCGAVTEEEVVQAALRAAQGWLILEDIPARVCKQCGEQFYDEGTAEKIERITANPAAKAAREILVPVFSLAGPSEVA